LFIGGGAMVEQIKVFIESNPDINVAYVGSLPLEKKNLGLAACDIAIVSLEADMSGLGVPSKAYFSMAADKPIVAVMDSSAEISMVVTEYEMGWCCDPNNPGALASVFDGINKDDIYRLNGRPRSVLQEHFSEERSLAGYHECIAELVT